MGENKIYLNNNNNNERCNNNRNNNTIKITTPLAKKECEKLLKAKPWTTHIAPT